jgi:hypothetical protein
MKGCISRSGSFAGYENVQHGSMPFFSGPKHFLPNLPNIFDIISRVEDPHWFQCGSGSRVSINKILNFTAEKITIFYNKNFNYLSLGLYDGRPSYRRNLQPSKVNIQYFKFFYTCGSFLPSWIWNRIKADQNQCGS